MFWPRDRRTGFRILAALNRVARSAPPVTRALSLILGATTLPAQRITGLVRDSASRQPIAGGVVTFADGGGHALRQLITDTAGRFVTLAPAGAVRLRVLHIGFRPVEREVRAAPGTSVALDLLMSAVVIELDAVQTSSRKICSGQDNRGSAAAELWQQARAGLLATVVARRAVPADVHVLTFHQVYDSTGDHLLQQRSAVAGGSFQRPFGAAASAGDFAHTGFVVDAGGARTYYAPDADVLLDPQFAAEHCFSVAVDARNHAGEIGLAFEPARNASNGIVDVAGTLWLRTSRPEMEALTFYYVNIEAVADAASAGGTLTFTTMSNGVVVLSSWELTAPVVAKELEGPFGSRTWHYRVTQVHHIGGVLADASWPGGDHWVGPLGTLGGRVVRGTGSVPAPGVRVWLDITGDSTTTGADGTFRFPNLLPGMYTLHAVDPALLAFHAEPPVQLDVVVRVGQDTLPSVVLLSYDDIEHRLCQDEAVGRYGTVVMGRLTTDRGPPPWAVELRLTWPAGGMSEGASQRVAPSAGGRFYVCGIPRRRPISVRALRDTAIWLDTVLTTPDAPVYLVALALGPRGAAPIADSTGTILGSVADSTGRPLPGVHITIGDTVNVRSDSLGNFVSRRVRSGAVLLRARLLGYAPRALAVPVVAHGATSVSVVMAPVAVVLPTVAIGAKRDTMHAPEERGIHKLDLFYRRRATSQGGEFFTRTEIEQRYVTRLSDLLEGKAARLPRCRNAGVGTEPRYQLFIDDLPYATGADWLEVLDAIPPWDVEGLEIYTSVTQLPVEAMANGCAAIFVWMRSAAPDSG